MIDTRQANSPAGASGLASTAAPVAVREMRESDAASWTDFVGRHPAANLYHTLLWREMIEEVFGHQPIYMIAERAGRFCGALPMFLVRAPLFGSKLISLPYDIGSGGALATDEATERALVERAISVARERQVNYLELRCNAEREALASLGLQRSEPVLISEMELDSEAGVWARMERNHQKAIRKAAKSGITVREAESLTDYDVFYRIYLQVFRAFGTPPYGAAYFPAVWRLLQPSGAARLLLAYAGSQCMGGLLLFHSGQNLVNKLTICLPEANPLRANAALYWRSIQIGLALGGLRLSLGSSARHQAGLIEFKERWGAETRPAILYDLPVRGHVPAIERYYSGEGLTRRIWRRLPLGATRLGGPVLNRWFC